MDFKTRALQEIRSHRSILPFKRVIAGFDGFVDMIVEPVATRSGPGEAFIPFATIAEFGQRVLGASGKSTNLELYPRLEKLGGNGTIMAGALLASGVDLAYIGALGKSAIHPVFQDFARRSEVFSLCDPAATTAVEFADGKLMLGQMKSFDEITFDRIVEKVGIETLRDRFARADLIALCNWTMIPHMTKIFVRIVEDILPTLPARDRVFFFDLADPEKRSVPDLLEALRSIGRFEEFGQVTLGLNLKEAQQVCTSLGFPVEEGYEESLLRQIASDIREKLAISTVVVHPRSSAACATVDGTSWIPGPYAEKPLITTGAGDHFNAGFTIGQLLALSPEACLLIGVCTSGYYVRTAKSPSLDDLETFIDTWN